LTDGGLDERGVIPTTFEFILDSKSAICSEESGPFRVDFAFEIERPAFIGDVAWGDEEAETYPEEKGVDGKEGAVVEEYTCPSEDRCEYTKAGCDGGENELLRITHAYDVGMRPDIKPGK